MPPPASPARYRAAPAKDRARGRVLGRRRQGLSTSEISARLAAEGTPPNRTSVGEVLAEEGFGRLPRDPAPAQRTAPATAGRDTRLPRAQVIDVGAWPVGDRVSGLTKVLPLAMGHLTIPQQAVCHFWPQWSPNGWLPRQARHGYLP